MILLPLLYACDGKPAEDTAAGLPPCPEPVTEGWEVLWEDEVRLDGASATWSSDGLAVSSGGDACATRSCVTATGEGSASASMLLNRGVDYHLTARVTADHAGAIEVVQHLRAGGTRVLASEAWTEAADSPVSLGFILEQNGSTVDLVLRLDQPGVLVVDGWSVTGPQWARVEAEPEAPLPVGFLVHVEDSPAFETEAARWSRRGLVLESLAERLAAHGARLTVQPDSTFVRGALAWDPAWFDRMEALGTDWSAHLHDEAGGAEGVEAAARDARRAFEEAGRTVTDLNGGFGVGPWARLEAAGYRSLSAYKNADTQLGLSLGYAQPWRPADGTTSADEAAFATHDPEGPLVYLPGMAVREADHARLADFGDRVLSQALAHTRSGWVQSWYFLDHVDAFGPSDDEDALAAWLEAGELTAELDLVERLFTEVLDPEVAAGRVRYATPTELAGEFLEWEASCR